MVEGRLLIHRLPVHPSEERRLLEERRHLVVGVGVGVVCLVLVVICSPISMLSAPLPHKQISMHLARLPCNRILIPLAHHL